MEKQIYELLNYIKMNNRFPKCEELKISKDRLIALVRKCNDDFLLDKEYIYVNILGEIEYEENIDMGITPLGLKYLKEENPVGNIIY